MAGSPEISPPNGVAEPNLQLVYLVRPTALTIVVAKQIKHRRSITKPTDRPVDEATQ